MLLDFRNFPSSLPFDYPLMRTIAIVFAGILISAILVHFASAIGKIFGVIDDPKKALPNGVLSHKRHSQPVPAVGGIIFGVAGVVMVGLNLLLMSSPTSLGIRGDLIVSVAVGAMMLMGLLDDRKHIPALRRLILSTLIFLALIISLPRLILWSIDFPSIGWTAHLGVWAVPFTLACLVGFQNAINMVDGRNGLLLGLSIMWMLHFLEHAPSHMVPLMLGLLGTGLVLFAANLRGRLFMGDCGAYAIATYFGITALNLHGHGDPGVETLRANQIVMMFLVPTLDLFRLILTRIRAGTSPFMADNNHLHHLLDDWIGWRRGWWVYIALAGAPMFTYELTDRFPALTVGAGILGYVLVVRLAKRSINARTETGPADGWHAGPVID